LFQEDILR